MGFIHCDCLDAIVFARSDCLGICWVLRRSRRFSPRVGLQRTATALKTEWLVG